MPVLGPASEQDAAAGALLDYLHHRQRLALTDGEAAEVRWWFADLQPDVPLEDVRANFRRA